MGSTLGETSGRPAVRLSELAALKLKLLLFDQPDASHLAYRVVPATTGCGSTGFQLTLTETKDGEDVFYTRDIPFSYAHTDLPFLDGLTIELDRQSGKLALSNPFYAPEKNNCCTDRD